MSPQPPHPYDDRDDDAGDLVSSGAFGAANGPTDDSIALRENHESDQRLGIPDSHIDSDFENRRNASSAPGIEASPRPFPLKETDHAQSLRSKLVLSLAIMLAVVVGIDEIVRLYVIAPEFADLELVAARKDTNRVLSAINTEVDFLAETAAYGVRRCEYDSQRFQRHEVGAGGTEHRVDEESGGSVARPKRDRVEWAAVVTTDGLWDWISADQSNEDAPQGAKSINASDGDFPAVTELLSKQKLDESLALRGMATSNEGDLYLFAALPLERSGMLFQAGEVDSFFVVGQRFSEQVVSEIEDRTSVRFTVQPLQSGEKIKNRVEIESKNSSFLFVKSPLVSPTGQPLGYINVRLPRDVTNRSNRTTAFARYLSLCGACGSLLLLLLLLQRIVIGRLEMIRQHTERIAQAGIISEETMTPVLRADAGDEIGQLAQSFDRMRIRLGDAQCRLSDASHAAGMSLVADTVIHNVGNVLTNVNSLIETASRRVASLRIEPLEKLATRLKNDDVDEAFQRATPNYLQRLSETLEDDRDDLTALLQTLNDNVQHIHQVIRDQRRHANQPVKWNQLSVCSIINDAVRCSNARLEQENVTVNFDPKFDVRIWTDRSLLLQILINVIGNAGNATRDVTSRQPTLTIDLIRTKSTVQIRLLDNGCGIDPLTLARIFDAHFTTRQSGSGLGLHFCAITMKRIGGAIHAKSDGRDQGATFIVEVPLGKPFSEDDTGRMLAAPPAEISGSQNEARAGFQESL